ncbi:uncharacterized protein LOC130760147 isoform X2 [Actinidia eriantha]|uniref:uncharacterized protein LOC130760147 isoform X2 n=1 Tax=Actinidia eriantha TaxID=165200 RepID=UPI0025872FE3|nr:uncharacterized protein LOC130760147 isoform X2 [Actinidia eriantha]
MADDLVLDLAELRHLESIAKRPRVVSLISSEIRNLEKLSEKAGSTVTSQTQTPSTTPTPIPTAKVVSNPVLNYVTLASFSWDQDNDKVKIYLSLEGVDQEKMETDIKPMSIDMKFHDVQGKNYRCAIPKLNKEIVPDKCKVVVKPTRVIITLPKASKGNWLDLHFKEDKLKPNLDKDRDPMAGIMDLMKVYLVYQGICMMTGTMK